MITERDERVLNFNTSDEAAKVRVETFF